MNEQLIRECLRMLRERQNWWGNVGFTEPANTYGNAADMLEYAIDGNAECLAQFDYFTERRTEQ